MKCYDLAKALRTLRYIRNIHFALLAAWREIYITQKISARKNSSKGAKDAKGCMFNAWI